jgi:transposase
MGEISTVGLDIAKSVFQVHGVDSSGEVVICKCEAIKVAGIFRGSATLPCRY